MQPSKAQRPKRVGVIMPPPNPTVEPEFQAALPRNMIMHASRTCRGMSNSQFLIADSAKRKGRHALFFEGDVADESFYKDELLNTRLEAMIESLDAQRQAA